MTTEKNISQLPSATGVNASDFIHLSQGGVDKKIPATDMSASFTAGQVNDPVIKEESSTSRTLTLADSYAYIQCINGALTTVTVLAGVFKIGNFVTLRNDNGGGVTLAAGAGVTISGSSSGLTLSEDKQVGTLLCTGVDTFDFMTGGSASTSIQGAITFPDVATMISGDTLEGGTITDWSGYTGWQVYTVVNNTTSKTGGAPYTIKTVAQAAADGDVIDGTGVPNYLGVNHALTGGTHVAILNDKNVTFYKSGCRGDGVNDDLTAAQLACDHVGAEGGGTVLVEVGEYYFSDNFVTGVNQVGLLLQYSGVHLKFESKKAVIKTNPATQRRGISVQYGTDSNPAQAIDGIKISGGKLDGMNTDALAVVNEYSHGVSIRRCSGVEVSDMDIVRFRGDQVFIGYGADTIRILNSNIDGQRSTSLSGTRQGIAVLSGQNIWIQNNKIRGGLLGVDLECDDNQVGFGYDFLRSIWVESNEIEDMGSEGFGLITPLVTSPIDIDDIHVNGNTFKNIDETVMDFDIDVNAGNATRIECVGNTSDGSNTFKGISISGIENSTFERNIIIGNADIGLQIGARCSDLKINGNHITSTGNDAVRVQESGATSRLEGIQFAGGTYKTTSGGSGIEVSGAFNVSINGGYFSGDQSGITARGSSTAGTATDVIIDINGGTFESTVNTGWALISDTDLRSVKFTGSNFKNASGATFVTRINAAASQATYLNHCSYEIDGVFTNDGRVVCENLANADRVIIEDSLEHKNTSAELNDISHYSNTVSKYQGKQVYNSTLSYPLTTNSSTGAGVWADGSGVTKNTPV